MVSACQVVIPKAGKGKPTEVWFDLSSNLSLDTMGSLAGCRLPLPPYQRVLSGPPRWTEPLAHSVDLSQAELLALLVRTVCLWLSFFWWARVELKRGCLFPNRLLSVDARKKAQTVPCGEAAAWIGSGMIKPSPRVVHG